MFQSLLANGDPVSWFFIMAGIGFGSGVITGFVSRAFVIAS